MNKLKLFDVSLRDGLQSIQKVYSIGEKKDLFYKILNKYNPHSIEIGSIVSPKVLPQMHNSVELFHHANKSKFSNLYMLTPNLNAVNIAIKNNIKNYSLITSVSNEFQKKNINKDLNDTKKQLKDIICVLKDNNVNNIKLYVSCINKCPISGNQDVSYVLNELHYYINNYKNNIDEFCLSDTCGTLEFEVFKNILTKLIIYHGNSNIIDKLSLHLHRNENFENTSKIISYAYEKGIRRFDVSCLENAGGCSVTIDDSKLNNNLHYDDYKEIFNK